MRALGQLRGAESEDTSSAPTGTRGAQEEELAQTRINVDNFWQTKTQVKPSQDQYDHIQALKVQVTLEEILGVLEAYLIKEGATVVYMGRE